jgi:hypothetical protein
MAARLNKIDQIQGSNHCVLPQEDG